MIFRYTKSELEDLKTAEKYRFIQGNGLGGYIASTAAFSVTRCDDGILCSSVQCPNIRKLLVHRLKETLQQDSGNSVISMQRFADGSEEGEGLENLEYFEVDALPEWKYKIGEITVRRTCAIIYGQNASVIEYEIYNQSSHAVKWITDPGFLMSYKGEPVRDSGRTFDCELYGKNTGSEYYQAVFSMEDFDQKIRICTDGIIEKKPDREELLAYPDDEKDGRTEKGYEAHAMEISWNIAAGEKIRGCILFSLDQEQISEKNIYSLLDKERNRREKLLLKDKYTSQIAQELCRAADLYISEKEATGGFTLIAGYPLFGDWGRDTMISLPGCMLATGKYDEAREIFNTFLKYERNGLVPNLFPDKGQEPWYNSVDAPLLLIEGLKLYADRTSDWSFIEQQYGVLEKIISSYMEGTDFNIHMDNDGLIEEGEYPWQLTWMDACIDGILPTPRYGKPVEINAYWYNALMVMAEFSSHLNRQQEQQKYSALAGKVRESFIHKFWIPEKGYLKDLVSGKPEDMQIRCNQIWALSLSYTMLSEGQEKSVIEVVEKYLYTPYGLRTLAPDDPEYKGFYGGPQLNRDMAYHQGTIWVYPMGAWYRAVLKTGKYSEETIAEVENALEIITSMLKEGCAGQLPEIYDGDTPGQSKGCYAQCWSVGEILRVYEAIEKTKNMECRQKNG